MTQSDSSVAADQRGALARALVAVVAEYTGRGPNKIRVTIAQDLVCVVMRDNHTKGERALLAAGERDLVAELRGAYHRAMKPALTRVAREITAQPVQSVFADHDADADVSTFNFVLAPASSPTAAAPRPHGPRVNRASVPAPALS